MYITSQIKEMYEIICETLFRRGTTYPFFETYIYTCELRSYIRTAVIFCRIRSTLFKIDDQFLVFPYGGCLRKSLGMTEYPSRMNSAAELTLSVVNNKYRGLNLY